MNIEYIKDGKFPLFNKKMQGKNVAVMYDKNTMPFALDLKNIITCATLTDVYFDDADLVPSNVACDYAKNITKNCDYLLAVGSGSLNDMAKLVSTELKIECGVMPTAASMDGYVSKGSAIMINGVKVTKNVHTPEDILINVDVIASAPHIMTASGFGDIMGKYTCLTDWKLSHIMNGEEINQKAFDLMVKARTDCVELFDSLVTYDNEAIARLIEALITAGIAMAECGNSRPASGSEHHMSHFLEMDFVKRGEKIPMHGIKVAIGTLISIELYNHIKFTKADIPHKDEICALAETLPKVEEIKGMLNKMGCPLKFSEIGVRRETMEEMLEKAYTVRDRYTILTLYNDYKLMSEIKPLIMDKYY